MADAEVKIVVIDGVRYREEHVPSPVKEHTDAQPVKDGAEVEHKRRTPRKTAARTTTDK